MPIVPSQERMQEIAQRNIQEREDMVQEPVMFRTLVQGALRALQPEGEEGSPDGPNAVRVSMRNLLTFLLNSGHAEDTSDSDSEDGDNRSDGEGEGEGEGSEGSDSSTDSDIDPALREDGSEEEEEPFEP